MARTIRSSLVSKAGPYSRHGSGFTRQDGLAAPQGQVAEAGIGIQEEWLRPWERACLHPAMAADLTGTDAIHRLVRERGGAPSATNSGSPRPSLIGFCHPTAATP